MKILLFLGFYQVYVDSLYIKDSTLSELSYEQQLEKILADNFGWPPALVKRLEQMGHEVKILLVNVMPLQHAWAKQKGYEFDSENWQYTVSSEQVKRFSPDVMWISSMFNYFGDYLGQIKPYCKRIFAWAACPLPKSLDLSHIDCMLTSHANYRDYFNKHGKAAEILLPSFEESILASSNVGYRDIGCSFVGGLSWAHTSRIEVVRRLVEKTPIQIWSDYPKLISRGVLDPRFWSAYFRLASVKSRINPSIWGMNMYKILARSKITVNVHAEVASGLAGNIRMFEATGMGALLFTEDAPNIRDLFEPGKEVITYKSIENLIELINYYIDRPSELELIAQAGQARTLKDHSTVERSKELLNIFNKYI